MASVTDISRYSPFQLISACSKGAMRSYASLWEGLKRAMPTSQYGGRFHCGPYALRISRRESTRSINGRMLNWPAIDSDSSSKDMAVPTMVKKHATYRRSHA